MRRDFTLGTLLLLGPVVLGAQAPGQTLAQRVAALGDGTLRLSFAARPGVCGNGGHGFTVMNDGSEAEGRGEWEGDCAGGPVRVSMRVRAGRLADSHTYVGGRWRPAGPGTTDLGTLPAGRTAAELLAVVAASRTGTEALVTAATLADSATVWPELLRFARRTDLSLETRRQAVFWLGQAAGAAATAGLDSIAGDQRGDLEVRKQAVFALSQRPADEGVPALVRIARTNPHPQIRKSAIFWLAQSEDPRALALFEELLR